MCGISGIITRNTSLDGGQVAERMVGALAHRGPDSRGIEQWTKGPWNVFLGNNRLAILDLSPAGRQPMVTTTHRDLGITYNGEIYNFRELRDELSASGTSWKSGTDTEVVLRGYAQWGREAIDRLQGMFAVAIWDGSTDALVLARDPLGMKPLYYFTDGQRFLFASEIRALLASGLVPRRVSARGIASYLECGSVTAPETILAGARSVLPGHVLTVTTRGDHLHIKEFPYTETTRTGRFAHSSTVEDYDAAVADVRELLESAVRRHLVSDVPVGVFLSGGIDSSALVALMRRVSPAQPKTFTVVFGEREFSERTFARAVAAHYDTDHQELPLREEELLALLPEALAAMDQPTFDGINTYAIAGAVHATGLRVALSGLGGDELFAGYPTFARLRHLPPLHAIPQRVRAVGAAWGRAVFHGSVPQRKTWDVVESDASPQAMYRVSRELFSHEERGALFPHALAQPAEETLDGADADPANAMSWYELHGYLANTLLRDTDMMSMAHSLEVRVPLLDTALVSRVLGLPGAWKVSARRPKPLLLDALGDLLPPTVWRRPKMGFTLPFASWMHRALRPDLERTLTRTGDLFSHLGMHPPAVTKVWREFTERPRQVGWTRPWALYVLTKWCERHGVTQ